MRRTQCNVFGACAQGVSPPHTRPSASRPAARPPPGAAGPGLAHSHSMVLGGLEVMSYTTRLTLRTAGGKRGGGGKGGREGVVMVGGQVGQRAGSGRTREQAVEAGCWAGCWGRARGPDAGRMPYPAQLAHRCCPALPSPARPPVLQILVEV